MGPWPFILGQPIITWFSSLVTGFVFGFAVAVLFGFAVGEGDVVVVVSGTKFGSPVLAPGVRSVKPSGSAVPQATNVSAIARSAHHGRIFHLMLLRIPLPAALRTSPSG